jgi:hypothetical protein
MKTTHTAKTYTVEAKLLTRRGAARHYSYTWVPCERNLATLEAAEAVKAEYEARGKEARVKAVKA